MKLLDLFCGAGGASMGYSLAGFEVVGVDIRRQPNYPFKFIHGDAIDFLRINGHLFDVIHASPPCEAHSRITGKHRSKHRDFITETRQLLEQIGKPWVIENVEGSPLINPIKLCGSMFNLQVRRHRLFETSHVILAPQCNHAAQTGNHYSLCWKNRQAGITSPVVGVYGHINYAGEFKLRCEAMDVSWMNNRELVKAIPPAYTKFIGKQLINIITGDKS